MNARANEEPNLEVAAVNIKEAKAKIEDSHEAPENWPNRDKKLIIDFSRIHENFAFHFRKIKIDQNSVLFSENFKALIDKEMTLGKVFPPIEVGRRQLRSEEEDGLLGKFYFPEVIEVCKKFLREIKDDSKMYNYQSEGTAVAQIRFGAKVAALGYLEGRTFYVRWIFFEHEWHDSSMPCQCGSC